MARIFRWRLVAVLLALLPIGLAAAQQGDAARKVDVAGYGAVGYARIDGVIDHARQRYFDRALSDAKAAGIDTLVVHINTDGGAVFQAREMLRAALHEADGGLRLVAFVDFRAISAGAMIAFGHDEIFITDTASIGDIGVVFVNREGQMEFASEKVETVVRTLLAQAAETRGWSRGLLLKMTARNQLLYRVNHTVNGEPHVTYLIEDDVADFRADHPDVDFDDSAQVSVYRGKDRLLTLTGREAVSLGMATALVDDLNALYERMGVDAAAVTDFSPNFVERSAYSLALLAPMLAGLALLFIIFELKTPGVGLWATLGALFGAMFLAAQFFQDLAESYEVIIMLLGVILIAVEFMTLAGGGALGVVGAGLLFGGLILAFVPNELDFDWHDPVFRDAVQRAGLSALGVFAILLAGVLAFIRFLPSSRLMGRVALAGEVRATSDAPHAKGRVGQRGVTVAELRPSGLVEIDGLRLSASAAHGRAIGAGAAVVVTGERFGELLVEAQDDAGR